MERNIYKIGKELFITNDEEIKEGDYRFNIQRGYFKKSDKEGLAYYNKRNDVFKKIVLTTDPDLIKDGVQAIDDEFLEATTEKYNTASEDTIALLENNWQQGKMYSEEDMKNYANYILAHIQSNKWELELTPKEWVKQFKKK